MSDESPVHRLRQLLSEAVSCLETSSSSVTPTVRARSELTPTPTTSISISQPGPSSSRNSSSRFQSQRERNTLFNFGGCGTSRGKRLSGKSPSLSLKKKKRVVWNHEFYCVSSTNQNKVPTAMEKCRLISAGKCSSCNSFLAMACFNYKYWHLTLSLL